MRNLTVIGCAGLLLVCAAIAQGQSAPAGELKVGDMAPNFRLQASDGKTYNLTDYKDKRTVVLAWFPAAFTRGCTIECKSLAENGDQLKKYQVTYFMASVDPIEKNTEFAAAQKADFPLLSDTNKEVAKAYGVLNERGVANRWTFYIGRDGRILAIDKAVKPETSAQDMASKLGELKVPQGD